MVDKKKPVTSWQVLSAQGADDRGVSGSIAERPDGTAQPFHRVFSISSWAPLRKPREAALSLPERMGKTARTRRENAGPTPKEGQAKTANWTTWGGPGSDRLSQVQNETYGPLRRPRADTIRAMLKEDELAEKASWTWTPTEMLPKIPESLTPMNCDHSAAEQLERYLMEGISARRRIEARARSPEEWW